MDVAHQLEYPWIIGQTLTSNFQLSQSTLVIEIALVKIFCTREVRFARIGTEVRGYSHGCVRSRKAQGSMVVAKEVNAAMRLGELAVRLEKGGIMRDSLF